MLDLTRPSRAATIPLVEITDVTTIPTGGELDGQSLDYPRAGTGEDTYLLPVSGWVHAGSSPPQRVHVSADGRRIASAGVRFPRPDVAAHLGVGEDLPVGFLTDVNLLGLPQAFELVLSVELEDQRDIPFMAIRGARRPLSSSSAGPLQPIFVTNIGRCGSTLMMNLLRGHPRIAVHDLYPYETRSLSYWVHMLKVLSDPANHQLSASPNTYEDDRFWVGHHPHNMRPVIEPVPVRDYMRRDYINHLAGFCQTSAEDFYRAVCEAQGVEAPIYFAEKRNPRPTARIASELYPDGREIFLVREPRDMVCSMISFYEKTQLVSFGRDGDRSDEEFVSGIATALGDLVTHLTERRSNGILVRYEDMIGDTPATLERVLDYLELPTDEATRETIVARTLEATSSSRRHRTTASGDASIGRWKRDLDPPMQELCAQAFGELISQLGYED